MKLELKELLGDGVHLETEDGLELNIRFSTTAYSYPISIEFCGQFPFWSNKSEALKILNALEFDREKTLFASKLLNNLSWKRRSRAFIRFLVSKDFEKVLKSVYLSMIHARYRKAIRKKVETLVKKGMKKGWIRPSKWTKKIFEIEKKVVFDMVFNKRDWSE